jgi:hypothetical protein
MKMRTVISPLAGAALAGTLGLMLRDRGADDIVITVGGDDTIIGHEPRQRLETGPRAAPEIRATEHDLARIEAAKQKRARKAAKLARTLGAA